MKRWFAVSIALVFVAGCSGAGGGGNRFLPEGPAANILSQAARTAPSGERLNVNVRMRIPRRHRGERTPIHPASISPLTQSVGIAVNGAKAKIFNATPSSPNCSIGAGGLLCTFSVAAPAGNDTFTVSTYSGTGGGGTILDRGVAVIAIAKGKANSPSITIGPVVSSAADTGMGSLRYAIANANAGDTIMFVLPAGTTVTLSSPITISNAVSVAGPGVKTSIRMHRNRRGLKSNLTFSGLTLSGNNANQVFVINAGATVTLTGLIITAGKASVASQPGGAISNNGYLTLAGDAITGSTSVVNLRTHVPRKHASHHHVHHPDKNQPPRHDRVRPDSLHPHCVSADQYGGGVYNGGTLIVSGTTFDSNSVANVNSCSSGYGGAIYNDYYSTLTVSDSTFSGNAAYEGGAVYNYAYYGTATFTNDTFTGNVGCTDANGCPTTGCAPSTYCGSYAQGEGAAIYDDEGPGVQISGSTFNNNVAGGSTGSAWGYGGALYLDTQNPSVTNSTFVNNVAGGGTSNCSYGEGGAIYFSGDLLELDNNTFTNNFAGGDYYGYGGAVYINDPTRGSNNSFTGNMAVGSGSPCESNGYSYAGAVYVDDTTTMSNSTFANNIATGSEEGYGGAVVAYSTSTFNTDTFTNNAAIGTGVTDATSYAYGGAMYTDDTVKVSNSTFTANVANAIGPYGEYAYGGAIYNTDTLNLISNAFTSNSISATYPADGYAYGGAVYSDSTLNSLNDAFKSNSNTATYEAEGGGIYTDSSFSITGDTVSSNTASAPYAYGGGLYLDSNYTVSNSTITGNVAGTGSQLGYGGGIYDEGGFTLNGSTVSGNSAPTAGGGLYSYSTETINNSTFTGNVVTNAGSYYGGGGIYNDGPDTIVNSTISGNKVTVAGLYAGGGGIYNDDDLTMTGSTVSGNSVLGNVSTTGGGGVFSYSAATVSNSTITGNSSSTDGGGWYQYSSGLGALANVTLYQNKAAGNGGNVENAAGNMGMANDIAAGGTAARGADIDNQATLTSYDYNIIQTAVTGTPLAGTTTHNLTANPLLLALSGNGGPTFTNADQANSPGTAYIPWTSSGGGTCGMVTSMAVDQRNFSRGAGGKCDAGAFEFGGVPSALRVHVRSLPGNGHHRNVKPKELHNAPHAASSQGAVH